MHFLQLVALLVALHVSGAQQFSCMQRSDGTYSDPNNICSQIYWSCISGTATIKFCQDGLAYSTLNGTCVNPKSMPECSQLPVGLPFNCKVKPDGSYPNNASICSPISGYRCQGGVQMSTRYCYATARFDVLSQHCLFARHLSACGGNNILLPSDLLPPPVVPRELQYDCLKKVGNFPDPENPCSNLFVICGPGGFPSAGVCPAGTVYDADFDWCNYPQYVIACGGHPPVTAAPSNTTASPTMVAPTLPPVSPFNCDGLDIGYYPNSAAPCSNIFYACTGGKWGIPETCSAGTFFDPILNNCNYRDNIPECGGARPNVTTATKLPGATGPQPTLNCTGMAAGNYPDPTNACSRQFIMCTLAGTAVTQTCPLNTWYDMTVDECLFFAQVPACSGTPKTMPPQATQPVTIATVAPFSCIGKQERNYPPWACADFFYECANGVAFKFSCPPGLKYDEFSDQCLRESDVYGCPKYVPRSTFCATKTVTGFYPYPGQCSSFVFCCNGIEAVLSCPSGSVFNTRTNRCELSTLVSPPCGTGPNPAPLTCGTTPSSPGRRRRWSSVGAIRSSETDCGVYITCSSSDNSTSGMISRCAEGFAFNPHTSNCTPAYEVPEGVCFPPAQVGLSKFCADLPDGIYAFPGNCRRALICVQKHAYLFYCWDSATPYFDPIERKCSQATISCTANMNL